MQSNELIIDSFAGGGGASLGIQWATGRSPDVAINHDAAAIAMHAANHPETLHVTEDVWKAHPRTVTRGRPVGLLWASPDCKHFSRAKGGKPVSKNIRSLAWVVVRWALECRPRVIILENVREFADWGPLDAQYKPCPNRKGLTFRRWVGRLRGLGYAVDWRVLDAADYGAPTHRRRLFLVARCDGLPITWPDPTHGDPAKIGKDLFSADLKPWRTAAECIDWSFPCPSIFERKRPLRENTLRRIAMGVKRYVLDNPAPFLVTCNHGGPEFRGGSLGDPLPTITASRDAHGLVAPILANLSHGEGVDGRNRGLRAHPPNRPIGTVHAGGGSFALVAPAIARIGQTGGGGLYAADARQPLSTVTSKAEHLLVAAFMAKHFGGMVGVPVDTPLPTTTARATQNQLVAANLIHLNHGEKQWSGCDEPLRTATTGNHAALVYSFLVKYFGTAIGQRIDAPLHTVTGKDRFGLVTVSIEGEPFVIVDIGMRMLKARELARGQGFPDEYLLTGTATSQVAKIGNSVSPQAAKAMVRANYVCNGKAVAS